MSFWKPDLSLVQLSGHVNQWHVPLRPTQFCPACRVDSPSKHMLLALHYLFSLCTVLLPIQAPSSFSPLPFFYPLTVSWQRFLPEETRRRVGNCFQTGLEGWSIYIYFCFDLLDWTGAAAGLACARPWWCVDGELSWEVLSLDAGWCNGAPGNRCLVFVVALGWSVRPNYNTLSGPTTFVLGPRSFGRCWTRWAIVGCLMIGSDLSMAFRQCGTLLHARNRSFSF